MEVYGNVKTDVNSYNETVQNILRETTWNLRDETLK